jgi:hypothetical protein
MKWWLDHLPKNAGTHDGFFNNGWRYIVDYEEAVRQLPPPGGRLHKRARRSIRRFVFRVRLGINCPFTLNRPALLSSRS